MVAGRRGERGGVSESESEIMSIPIHTSSVLRTLATLVFVTSLAPAYAAAQGITYRDFRRIEPQTALSSRALRSDEFLRAEKVLQDRGWRLDISNGTRAASRGGEVETYIFAIDGPERELLAPVSIESDPYKLDDPSVSTKAKLDLNVYNRRYDAGNISSANRWLIYVYSATSEPISYFIEAATFSGDQFPVLALSASGCNERIVFNLQEQILYGTSTVASLDVSSRMALNGSEMWRCFAQALGIPSGRSFVDIISGICTFSSNTQTVIALTISCIDCITIIGCADCVLGWASFLTCASSGISACYRDATGGDPGCSSREIRLGQSISDSWQAGCSSTHRTGRHAKFYTFSLARSAEIQIDLESSTDAFVYLLQGANKNGSVIASNDDGGEGTNSRIIQRLSAGDYTIEATTYNEVSTGSFTVRLTERLTSNPTPTSCLESIVMNSTINGNWTTSCGATHRSGSYARFYRFSLSAQTRVQINLNSAVDAYLILLRGSDQNGSSIAENDDTAESLNSQILTTLNAGTYVIEATTYATSTTGSFSISLRSQ